MPEIQRKIAIFAPSMEGKLAPQSEIIRQMRLPLIILVTYAHSYGRMAEGFSLLTSDWNTLEVLKLLLSQTLAKMAVPTFFVMSGYLFFANVSTWSRQAYCRKIGRRVKTLLVPYLAWNLLMAAKLGTLSLNSFWVYWHEAGRQTDWLGLTHLMTAPANMPLWFLRDLMVVSLLSPIIYIGVRKMGPWLLALLTPVYLSGVVPFIPGLSAYAVCFFTLGAFLGIRKMELAETFLKLELPAYLLSVVLALAMMLTYGQAAFPSLMLCFRLVSVAAAFCLSARIVSFFHHRAASPPGRHLPSPAYFIYLAHFVFFFSFVDKAFFALFGLSEAAQCAHYLLCPLLKAAIFMAIYRVYILIRRFFIENCHVF